MTLATTVRSMAIGIAAIGLLSCSYYSKDPERVGVFVAVQHMRINHLDWEGGNTQATYRELCNTVTKECFFHDSASSGGDRSYYSAYSKEGDTLAIYSNNSNRTEGKEWRLHLFDTRTGVYISCVNCEGKNTTDGFGEIRPMTVSMEWVSPDHLWAMFLSRTGDEHITNAYVFYVRNDEFLAYHPGSVVMSNSVDFAMIAGREVMAELRRVSRPAIDDAAELFAWVVCDESCELIVTDIESGEIVSKSAVACSDKLPYAAEWRGDHFAHTCYAGATVTIP